MLIGGSNAAGKPFPPLFQFPSEAQAETKCIHATIVQDMLDVFVQFGRPEKTRLLATVGMNPKGGMDSTKFHKYLLLLVALLYPDASDVVGKCMLIKWDSMAQVVITLSCWPTCACKSFIYFLPFQIIPL
jgi:hypothetical protein